MKQQSNAKSSARTKKSADDSLYPFREGTLRDKGLQFLLSPRTVEEFRRFVLRNGGNPRDLLHFFRSVRLKGWAWEESDGLIQWKGNS